MEKLNELDDDESGYKHYIINIIRKSGNFATMLLPLEDLLSRIKVPGTDVTGFDFFKAFGLVGEFVNLITAKPNPSYSLSSCQQLQL